MSIISAVTPNSTSDYIVAGGAGAAGGTFMAIKGGPSIQYKQFTKELDSYTKSFAKDMRDYALGRIPKHHVLPRSIDAAAQVNKLAEMANATHAPSPLRIATYAAVGALPVAVAAAGVKNLIDG